jgi:hypothetical protein
MNDSEMRVYIQLIGEELDLQDLQQVLNTNNWKVIKNDDGYYLEKFINNSKMVRTFRQL